jgi:hypothetical protein
VKTYIVSDPNWEKEIKLKELGTLEETIFEASTRAVEWALKRGKPVGLLVYLTDLDDEDREFISVSYKILNNAGYYQLAEKQRRMVKEDLGIDLAEEPISKIVAKLQEASIRKVFCIAKITKVVKEDRQKTLPVVCIELGIFEDEQAAKLKCKELNAATGKKMFVVKKIICNAESS